MDTRSPKPVVDTGRKKWSEAADVYRWARLAMAQAVLETETQVSEDFSAAVEKDYRLESKTSDSGLPIMFTVWVGSC